MSDSLILAIETSGRTSSLALLEPQKSDCRIVGERALSTEEKTAEALIPAIKQVLHRYQLIPTNVSAIAVASGPGSFTGLRIGITAAKTLAYALEVSLIGVNTLDVLAAQAPPCEGRVWSVLDAQRGDLFAACYDQGHLASLGTPDRTQLLCGEAWLEQLQAGDLVIGPVADRYADRLHEQVTIAKKEHCTPMASTVGGIGWRLLKQGQASTPFDLVPKYHRLSAAEEKARAAKR